MLPAYKIDEPLYTAIEFKTIEARRLERRKQKIIYFLKQKVSGFIMTVLGIIIPFVLDGDATASLIFVPLGLYLMFTKNKVMDM